MCSMTPSKQENGWREKKMVGQMDILPPIIGTFRLNATFSLRCAQKFRSPNQVDGAKNASLIRPSSGYTGRPIHERTADFPRLADLT